MQIVELAGLGDPDGAPLTEFQGHLFGAGVSFILVASDRPGFAVDLHRHPYPETFVIRAGQAEFRIGEDRLLGVAGQAIVVPVGTPHAFVHTGTDRLEMIDIHAGDRFITEWLEGPRAHQTTAEDAPNETTGSPWFRDLCALFAPVRQEAIDKGYTEDQINGWIDEAVAASRAERRARQP